MKQTVALNHQRTFPAMLRARAAAHPLRPAVVYIDDSDNQQELTYGQLWERCAAVASALGRSAEDQPKPFAAEQQGPAARGAASATPPSPPRAMLLFPPGVDFVAALVGAQLAGWIPVPTVYPKPYRPMPRLDAAARDCQPSLLLSDTQTLATLDRSKLDSAADLPGIATDALGAAAVAHSVEILPRSDSVAFLQYTSGSTSDPKGVIISQRNLMTNLEAIRLGFDIAWQQADAAEPATAVFWLPHYHDMGLVGGLLAPLYLGFRTVLISPQSFIRRPIRWLQAVDRYRATVTGAPNFAFELCTDRVNDRQLAGLDLSSLKVTFCGAEPIRPAALRGFATRFAPTGFRNQSYYPCYGLAESTLLVSGGKGPGAPRLLDVDRDALRDGRIRVLGTDAAANGTASVKGTTLVSCGAAVGDTELVVVDPSTCLPLAEDQIGEIWIRGGSVSAGYWNEPQESARRFDGTLKSRPRSLPWRLFGPQQTSETGDENRGYFRTGDLAFFHRGELFITGRLKDLIVIRGRNYFPQDIEATVAGVPESEVQRAVAVPAPSPCGESLAVIAEVDRHASATELMAINRMIRRALIEEHEVDPRQVLLVRPGIIPLTTSGKLQRSRCRPWVNSPFDFPGLLYRWQRSGGTDSPPLQLPPLPAAPGSEDCQALSEVVRSWIVGWLVTRGGVEPEEIQVDQRLEDYGLDSLMAIELIGDLEDSFDVELTPSAAAEHPTIEKIALLIACQRCGLDDGERLEAQAAHSPQAT